jgi:hypothetical protein
MRSFQIREEPGKTVLARDPDYKAILLIAVVDATVFLVYSKLPIEFRLVPLAAFTLLCGAVLWPRIIAENVTLTSRSLKYQRGLFPLILTTELEWNNLDPPHLLNAGVRGRRGPIGFNDKRTGREYRIGAGLQPPDCRTFLAAVDRFRARALF